MIPRQLPANPGSGREQDLDLASLSLCIPLSLGEIVLNLKVAARKKQMGWVFSPRSRNQRAFGGWTRVAGHFAFWHPGEQVKAFCLRLRKSSESIY